jgi:hypothetical protein
VSLVRFAVHEQDELVPYAVSQADAEAAALAAVSGEVVQAELDNEIDAGNAAVLGTEAGEDGADE